jgi:hypothetical protein
VQASRHRGALGTENYKTPVNKKNQFEAPL